MRRSTSPRRRALSSSREAARPMTETPTRVRVIEETPAYWRVRFDNPPFNIVDATVFDGLQDLRARMDASPSLRVVVFESEDPDFFLAHLRRRWRHDDPRSGTVRGRGRDMVYQSSRDPASVSGRAGETLSPRSRRSSVSSQL